MKVRESREKGRDIFVAANSGAIAAFLISPVSCVFTDTNFLVSCLLMVATSHRGTATACVSLVCARHSQTYMHMHMYMLGTAALARRWWD